MVSGIGCTGRMPAYVDFNTLHTTHGRALGFATGLKLVKPSMKIIVVMGDGDALSIGGNHFIHACRRNIEMTAIIINNYVYAMTGGQYSSTTPRGSIATTGVFGSVDYPFDVSRLAEAAGASFVARSTVYHVREAEKYILQAIIKKGFSVVEILSNCHTYYGRLNNLPLATDMLKWFKDNTVNKDKKKDGDDNKILRGILVDKDLPEYTEEYYKNVIQLAEKEVESIRG